MKKSFVLFVSVVLTFLFVSCRSKSKADILGKWETNLTLKSELSGNEGDGSSVGFLYSKQKITLAFSEGGVYTKSVIQTVEKAEFPGHEDEEAFAKEYFSQFFNKDLTFDGEYQQKDNSLFMTVDFVQEKDGERLSYSEFFKKDPSIGDEEYSCVYQVKDGFLFVDGIKYSKID